MSRHGHLEACSLAFGKALAARLLANPQLRDHALANLKRWKEQSSLRAKPSLMEWDELLRGSLSELISVLTDQSERSARLRQSNPFAGLLTPKERTAILRHPHANDTVSA
jgi:hypothetical protein